MSKIIRIEATSNIFEFNAEVPEKKAEKVLTHILKSFLYLKSRQRHIEVSKLKVKTSVINPELFS